MRAETDESGPGNPDHLIGERLRYSGTPLRWMDDPARDGSSVACWSAGIGGLDVHHGSGVGNHFFYLLAGGGPSAYGDSPTCDGASVTGIGKPDAGRIWYRALTTCMTSATDYSGARAATLPPRRTSSARRALSTPRSDAAWAAVGVNP